MTRVNVWRLTKDGLYVSLLSCFCDMIDVSARGDDDADTDDEDGESDEGESQVEFLFHCCGQGQVIKLIIFLF